MGKTKRIAMYRRGAIGDIIMTLNLIPELKKKYEGYAIDYFCHPYMGKSLQYLMECAGIERILPDTEAYPRMGEYEIIFNMYGYPDKEGYPHKPMKKHLIQYFADEVGVDSSNIAALTLPLPPRISGLDEDYATLQVKTGWSNYKEWFVDRWAEVVKSCDFPVIQIGGKDHPKIPGAIHDYLGQDFMASISLVANAKLHLGVDSFSNHLTNYHWLSENKTKRTRGVILWGATQWNASGYDHNININQGLTCQPCFKNDPKLDKIYKLPPCDNPPGQIYDEPKHACMDMIQVDRVKEAVKRAWQEETGKSSEKKSKSTICLTMIVKDEAHVIRELLEDIYKYLDYWVIVDTGSTDDTREIIKAFFEEKNIPGELHERPWRNFGHNRTEALRFADGKADYMWVIDADDKVIGELNLSNLTKDSYMLCYGTGFRYWRKQLFKSGLAWKYEGVLHEYATSAFERGVDQLNGEYYVESRRLGARNHDPKKYEKDAAVFEEALKEEPNNARYWFYLGQSYFDAKNFAEAKRAYKKRATMGGWREEVFYALFRIGECEAKLGSPDADIIHAYLEAYNANPSRAEPLHALAFYCRMKQKYEMGYLFAKAGLQLPMPGAEGLFVFTDVYKYMLLDELSVNAFYTQRHVMEGYEACQKLLTMQVSEDVKERARGNIIHYQKKLGMTK